MSRPHTGLDWTQPWFAPWRERGERVAGRQARGVPLHEALNLETGSPVRFVPQEQLPAATPYEAHIFATNTVPTRDNLHDFFNGLAWLEFAQAKRRLNQLQAAQLEAATGNARGPVRDAATVFDENGALLHAPAPLWQALLAREWKRAFIDLRALWAQAGIVLVGHALLEKMASPRKDLTAHVWRADAPADSRELDRWLAAQLDAPRLAAKPFAPLPLLGIPGWWPANADFSFYDDRQVFRPAAAHP